MRTEMPKAVTVVEPNVKPDPKPEKRTRRVLSTELKLSILQQTDTYKHGELGKLLRLGKALLYPTLSC